MKEEKIEKINKLLRELLSYTNEDDGILDQLISELVYSLAMIKTQNKILEELEKGEEE